MKISLDPNVSRTTSHNPYTESYSNFKMLKKSNSRHNSFSLVGVEKTPGPGLYMAPSDFGHLVEIKDNYVDPEDSIAT